MTATEKYILEWEPPSEPIIESELSNTDKYMLGGRYSQNLNIDEIIEENHKMRGIPPNWRDLEPPKKPSFVVKFVKNAINMVYRAINFMWKKYLHQVGVANPIKTKLATSAAMMSIGDGIC